MAPGLMISHETPGRLAERKKHVRKLGGYQVIIADKGKRIEGAVQGLLGMSSRDESMKPQLASQTAKPLGSHNASPTRNGPLDQSFHEVSSTDEDVFSDH